jgi:hypothetical protein
VQDGSLNKGDDLLGGTEDEASIILKEVTRDGPDTILLLGEGGEDVCEVGDIVRGARETVEFLEWKKGYNLRVINETNER